MAPGRYIITINESVTKNNIVTRYRYSSDVIDFYSILDRKYDAIELNITVLNEIKVNGTTYVKNNRTDGVMLEFKLNGTTIETINSEQNGTFEIYLMPEKYTVYATYENETTFVYISTLDLFNLTKVDIPIEIKLVDGVMISGYTYYDENRDGIKNDNEVVGDIEFTIEIDESMIKSITDIKGYYEFWLSPSEYNYSFIVNQTKVKEYGFATYTVIENISIESETVNISIDKEIHINFTGSVKYDLVPLNNITVILSSEDFNISTTTDNEGKYYLTVLSGEYNLIIEQPGFEKYITVINITENNRVKDITLSAIKCSVYGVTYYDLNDNDIYDAADIVFYGLDIEFKKDETITVYSAGSYKVDLYPGTYQIYTYYISQTEKVYCYFGDIEIKPGKLMEINIALIDGAKLYGDVFYWNATGKQKITEPVNLTITLGNNIKYIQVINGTYETYLIPGEYKFSISYNTIENGKDTTYSYDKTVLIKRDMIYDINLTREKIRGVSISWDETEKQTINQNETVRYTVYVKNTGNDKDTIKIEQEYIPAGWKILFNNNTEYTVELKEDESRGIEVNITSSEIALAGDNDIRIRAVSQNDPTKRGIVFCKVGINKIPDNITLSIDTTEKWLLANNSTIFTITVFNNGNNNLLDTINLTVNISNNWNVSLSESLVFIRGKDKKDVTLTVTSPENATTGETIDIQINAILERNKNITANITCKATVSLPDLTIINLTFSKSRPMIGEEIYVNASIVNIGKIEAFVPEGFAVKFYINDELNQTQYITETIYPEEYINISFIWNTTGLHPGIKNIKINIENVNETIEFEELNIKNNVAPGYITVGKIRQYWRLVPIIGGIVAIVIALMLLKKRKLKR